MAKQSGLGQRVYVSGSNISGDVASIGRIAGGPATLDFTDVTQLGYERQGGVRDGGIDATCYFNPSRAHPVLAALPTADVLVTAATSVTLGDPAASCVAKQIGYDGTRGQDGSFTMAVATQANGFGLEWGQLLTSGERTDTTGTNGTALDGGASSSFGLQMYVHLTAFTGTNVTIKIQDSADNATFADLSGATTGALTATGWARVAVTGTVRRYLRVTTTGTFTSATFVVNAVRNAVAVAF